MAEKTYSTIKDQLRDGAILKEFTKKDFLVITPIPSIHKVLWSIVKQGTSGKDCSKYFMDMEEFRMLCEDLNSMAGRQKLEADKTSAYPSAYQFTTGANGNKHLNIGGGQKGIRIQTQEVKEVNNEKKYDNRMVIVSSKSIREMAFLFKICMGIIPVGYYYQSLVQAYWEGEEQRAKYYAKDKDATSPSPRQSIDEPQSPIYEIQTISPVKKQGKIWFCKCLCKDKEYFLCFDQKSIDSIGDKIWKAFQEKSCNGARAKVQANVKDNNICFVSFVK